MLVRLIQTTTRDGVRLDGTYQQPAVAPLVPLDALCLLHGTGGNFYSSTLFDALAERLAALGVGVLRGNTRGHDIVSTAQTNAGSRRQGAAYERMSECRHDIAAWLAWLLEHSGPRVGLFGHSSGALKEIYALAHEPEIGAEGLIAISPPRLSYSWFSTSPQAGEFLDTYRQAQAHVRAGHGETLIEVRLPLPLVITAAGYLEKYGPEESYNYLRFAGKIRCPMLVTLGSLEVAENMAFRDAPEALAGIVAHNPRLRVETIAGADHFYNGVVAELTRVIEAWLRDLGRQ
jgi:pimeloyl-ACP methyl ester carboxylesterase